MARMPNLNCSSFLMSGLLVLLRQAEKPLTAFQLASRLGLSGNRESMRRKIRALAQALRNDGAWIVATIDAGYWLTEDSEVWNDWNNKKQIDAKRILGETHRRQKMIADRNGQGLLFTPPVRTGLG